LKVFNVLYGLKKIEDNKLIDKIKLKKPDCVFSHLVKVANEGDDENLANFITGTVLDSICKSTVRNLLFYEIPRNIKSTVFAHLIKEIDKISKIEKKCNVLLSGKIYEYFIGRDESAISELGAYFTDRHIVDYIYDKIKPKLNKDNSVRTMIDMFGGSGGFTTGYINYMNDTYSKKIDWVKDINKVFHYDMNEDVIKSAGLEFFCLTGQIPNMGENIKYKNSFSDEFEDKKYDYVITNPPYGGDKIKQSETQIKRTKLKKYIINKKKDLQKNTNEEKEITAKIKMIDKQLKEIENSEKQEKKDNEKQKVSLDTCSNRINRFSKKHKLTANDKEGCSLILMMDMVKEDGTCVGVLKEGVFFNRTYTDLRKCLINNFNVKEVISVPQDQFENTSTKTSIVIFDNTKEKTKEVKFYDLIVERYAEDKYEEVENNIYLTENKGDIKKVCEKLISSATLDELNDNTICSLNSKDYNKKVIKCGKDYELKKLGDICEFLPKSKRNASFGQEEGKYNFYTSSDKIKKCDIVDYKDECIIIGTGGNSCIHLTNNFSCSADTLILKSKTNKNKLIYYIIKILWNDLIDNMNGSTIKHITKDMLINFMVPIPKSDKKLKEWVDKISKPYDEKIEKQNKLVELEKNIRDRIQEITDNEDCEEVELEKICEINPSTMKQNEFKEINYIDISSVKEEKINNMQLLINNFPSRAKRIIRKYDILYSTVRPNLKGYTIINDDIKNCIASTGFAVIRSKNINPMYLYILLTNNNITEYLVKHSTGTNYPSVNPIVFKKIKIKLPKDKKLISNMDKLFQEVEKLQKEIKDNDNLYNQYIKELSNEAIIQ